MADGAEKKAGGWWDWPLGVILAALVLAFVTEGSGRIFAGLLFWFGVIALLIRRGLFTPRRR